MCEFHESTCNGFGDIWWTDNPIYFSSIDERSEILGRGFAKLKRDNYNILKWVGGSRSHSDFFF